MITAVLEASSRRSCLSVPANSPRKLGKARSLAADETVIDLEDSVATTAKAQARGSAVDALRTWSDQTVSVRVNQTRSQWCHQDLIAVASVPSPLASVVVPKVESAADVTFVERLLDGIEAAAGRTTQPIAIQALIETPAGLANADEIAGSSPRLQALVLGYADLAASLGRPPGAATKLDFWLPAQHIILVAARCYGLQAIDGPCLEFGDDEKFVAAATRARELGFDGKWAIHPSQVSTLNEAFTPTATEIEHARAVISALERSERESGEGVVAVEGGMIDEASRRSAKGVLTRAGQLGTNK
jgi:citrate lyase subunit beta / citryl-CoA lyase